MIHRGILAPCAFVILAQIQMRSVLLFAGGEQRLKLCAHPRVVLHFAQHQCQREPELGVVGGVREHGAVLLGCARKVAPCEQAGVLQAQAVVARFGLECGFDTGEGFVGFASVLIDLRLDQHRLIVAGLGLQHAGSECERAVVVLQALCQHGAGHEHVVGHVLPEPGECLDHGPAVGLRRVQCARGDGGEVGSRTQLVERLHLHHGFLQPAFPGEFGGCGVACFRVAGLCLGPDQGGLECGGGVFPEARDARCLGGDAWIAGNTGLAEIILECYIHRTVAGREFGHQERIQRVLREGPVNRFRLGCGGGLRNGRFLRACPGFRGRRGSAARQQEQDQAECRQAGRAQKGVHRGAWGGNRAGATGPGFCTIRHRIDTLRALHDSRATKVRHLLLPTAPGVAGPTRP